MVRSWLWILWCIFGLFASFSIPALLHSSLTNPAPSVYTYNVVNVYQHDGNAFTEGLVFEEGFLYESTGLYGSSTLRRVELSTGKVLQACILAKQYFGEGIAIVGDRIIQLTWREHLGLVYDKNSFALLEEFSFSTEGWGLTYDGKKLIMSDGTATLHFLDPKTFRKIGQIVAHDQNGLVAQLNELEYIRGKIYANIWGQERIAVINTQSGQVETWIDLTGIGGIEIRYLDNVLNGIAYDAENDRLFVTGKLWPELFEINLV